jgi:hypothetical protein
LQTHLLQCLLHLIEFERLDDGLDFLHRVSSPRFQAAEPRRNQRLVSRSRAKVAKTGKAQADQSGKMQSQSVCKGAGNGSAAKVGTLPIIVSTTFHDKMYRLAQCSRQAAIAILQAS